MIGKMKRNAGTIALITARTLVYAGIIFSLVTALNHKAEALAPNPRPSFPKPAAPAADVAIRGPHALIQAPESRFEIAVVASYGGTVKVTLEDACQDVTADNPGLKATIDGQTKSYPGDCSGGDIVFSNVSFAPSGDAKYNFKIKTRTLIVDKINGAGHQPFNVRVNANSAIDLPPSVSFDADSNPTTTSFSGDAFAMFAQPTVEFHFRTDCDYSGQQVFLKWQDGDAGSVYQEGHVTSKLIETKQDGSTVTIPISPPSRLGGEGEKVASQPLTLHKTSSYSWVWSGLDMVNALQVFIPFSENTYYLPLDCPNPPEGNLALSCTPKSYSVTGIKDQDDGTSAREWRIVYGGNNHVGYISGGGATDTGKGGTTYGSAGGSFNFTNNRVYFLQVKDDNGNWYNRDSASKNCPGSSGGPPASTCTGTVVDDPSPGSILQVSTAVSVIEGEGATARDLLGGTKRVGNANAVAGGHGVTAQYSKTYNYANEKAPTIHVTLTNQWWNGSSWVTLAGGVTQKDVTCYHASCQIDITGDGPGGIATVGGNVHVTATMIYHADPAYPDLEPTLPITTSGGKAYGVMVGSTRHTLSDPIDLGDESLTSDSPFDVATNGSISEQTITAYPDLEGYGAVGPNCNKTFDVYAEFNIVPKANIDSIDPENPTVIGWSTDGTLQYGEPVTATATSTLTKRPAGGAVGPIQTPPPVTHSTYGDATSDKDVFTYNNVTHIAPGDEYCAQVSIYPGHGWQGPHGLAPNPETVTAQTLNCPKTVNEPYVHFFDSDVFAGGGFGETCTSTPGGINTLSKTNGVAPVGSGVQIGALSIGAANGFSSAILRGTAPTGGTGLSFANTTNISAAVPKAGSGGNLGGSHCVTDYFAKMPKSAQDAPSTANNISLTANPTGNLTQVAQYYQPTGGTLTINSGLVDDGMNLAIYVDGDVVIPNGGLKYRNGSAGSPWSAIAKIPSLYIVAKGNIYIDGGVDTLDGLYVAQPNNAGNKGEIYTCSSGTTGYTKDNTDLLAQCNRQLVVNGAFVAKKVYFSRSFSSLRHSSPGERYTSATDRDCGDSGHSSNNDCAAEIFNFSPELYLSQPAIEPNSGPTTGKYDYITSLSPVL